MVSKCNAVLTTNLLYLLHILNVKKCSDLKVVIKIRLFSSVRREGGGVFEPAETGCLRQGMQYPQLPRPPSFLYRFRKRPPPDARGGGA